MFFLFIIIILFITFIAINTSRIEIKIEDFYLDTENKIVIDPKYKMFLSIVVFKKIIILKIDINKLKKYNKKFNVNNMYKIMKKNYKYKINYKELIKNIKIEIKEIDLEIKFGLEDAGKTGIITGILSGIIGNLLKKPKYQIMPLYTNKNLIKIKLNGIFRINLIHYIYSQIFKRKRRVDKNERTSNRKPYDDCYG